MMKDILIRLFIKLPLYIIWFAMAITLIIPLLYWIVSGRDYVDLFEGIDCMFEDI